MVNVVQQNGRFYVTDATAQNPTPYPIGRRVFTVGRHVVGFDDTFGDPVLMRAFYDHAPGDVDGATWLGYAQVCRLTFADTYAVRPSVFGGRLADRDAYLMHDGWWIDMMGPSDAAGLNVPLPLYAYNNLLSTQVLRLPNLYDHPLPNGSLRYLLSSPVGSSARYASISADLGAGLLRPKALEAALEDAEVVRELTVSGAQAAATQPYRLALTSLETEAGPGETPPLQGLDESQVGARLVGDHVLLTLPDDEGYPPTLCVSSETAADGSTVRIVVRLLSWYDLNDLERDSGTAALRRIAASLRLPPAPSAPAQGRGVEPLASLPALAWSPYVLALEVRTCAFAFDAKRVKSLDGFTWAVLFQFDADSGALESTAVRVPVATPAFDFNLAAATFTTAIRAAPHDTIDVTCFTRAALSGDGFAGGRRLTFVDENAQVVS